jgi:hypothetical protein
LAGVVHNATGISPTVRYSLSGSIEHAYAASYPGAGNVISGQYGGAVESSDGTDLVVDALNGLELITNGGTAIRELPAPTTSVCDVVKWWDAEDVLAECGGGMWIVPISGARPSPLTKPSAQASYDNAWKFPTETVVQQVACGSSWLDRVNPDGSTTELNVPGQSGQVNAFGVYGSQMPVLLTKGCDGASDQGSGAVTSTLGWYDPTTNAFTPLLGGPVNGGWVIDVVLFPDSR